MKFDCRAVKSILNPIASFIVTYKTNTQLVTVSFLVDTRGQFSLLDITTARELYSVYKECSTVISTLDSSRRYGGFLLSCNVNFANNDKILTTISHLPSH